MQHPKTQSATRSRRRGVPAEAEALLFPASLPSLLSTGAKALVQSRELAELVKANLTRQTVKLLTKLTGLPTEVVWDPSQGPKGPGGNAIPCPVARRLLAATDALPAACALCLREHWSPAALARPGRRKFVAACGATCFVACCDFGEKMQPVTLVLQFKPLHWGFAATSGIQPEAFDQALTLLLLVVQNAEITLSRRRALRELERAQRQLQNLAAENTRLRRVRPARLRWVVAPGAVAEPGSHAEQIVHVVFDYVRKHYWHQFSLRELAAGLRMNPAYLSSLFSRTTGVTWHVCLREFRLARAKELLRDPKFRIREIADNVGFSSATHFCRVFRATEGISPSAWRQA